MRRFLLAFLVAAWTGCALAQGVNSVPQIGVNVANTRAKTYSATSVALVPAAAATDVVCIAASPSKSVAIRRVEISGTAGTAINAPVSIVRRATVDTGGTAATGNALPVASPNNASNAAASAALTAFTANPTITDASPAILRAASITFPATTGAVSAGQSVWYFGTFNDAYDQGLDLVKGSTQQACVNLNGATVTTGLLYVDLEWTEQ